MMIKKSKFLKFSLRTWNRYLNRLVVFRRIKIIKIIKIIGLVLKKYFSNQSVEEKKNNRIVPIINNKKSVTLSSIYLLSFDLSLNNSDALKAVPVEPKDNNKIRISFFILFISF